MTEILAQRVGAKTVIEAEDGLLALHPSAIDLNRNWQWPGGIRDYINEPILETAIRETLEETGINLSGLPCRLLRHGEWTAVDRGEKVKILAIFFHFRLAKRPQVQLSDEHDDSAWLNRANHSSYQANPEVHEVVESVLTI